MQSPFLLLITGRSRHAPSLLALDDASEMPVPLDWTTTPPPDPDALPTRARQSLLLLSFTTTCNEPDGEKRWWSCLTFYTSYQNLPCTCTAQYPIPPVKVWMPKDRCASGLFASKVPRPTEERIWTDGTGTTQRATASLLTFSLPCRPIPATASKPRFLQRC